MADHDNRDAVRIVDVDMPFGSMVRFMVKWVIAAIPALIILIVVGAVVGGVVVGLTSGLMSPASSSRANTALLPSAESIPVLTHPAELAAPQWEVSQSVNPIDDSPIVVLSLDASSPASTLRSTPSLLLRCKSKRTEVYINWNRFLGSEETQVTIRLGHGRPAVRSWGLSTDNEASFYPGSASAFVTQLMSVDTLVAMTTPYSESPITAVFEVGGLADKVTPLRQACGW